MAKVHFFYSTMNAGKSTALLQSAHNYHETGNETILFIPVVLWLKFILNFFGIEKIEIICADQMALDYDKSIKDAEKQIENIVD